METVQSITPILALGVPFVTIGLIFAFNKKPNLRDVTAFIAAIITFSIVISMAPAILAGKNMEFTLSHTLPGADFKFHVDALGMVFATIASFLWIAATVYSVGYMRSGK